MSRTYHSAVTNEDTVDEISNLLLQILKSYKASTSDVTNEKLLTVEQICERTGFKERIYSWGN